MRAIESPFRVCGVCLLFAVVILFSPGCGKSTPAPVAEPSQAASSIPAKPVAKVKVKPGSRKAVVIPDEDTSFHLRKAKQGK